MRTVFRGTSALVLLMLVVSCSSLLKKKDEDAGAEASVAEVAVDAGETPAPVVAALATNEGDVARFPDETKLADTPAVLQRAYNVREAPPAGTVVTALSKGTAVTQIAQRGTYILLLVDNKAAPGTKLMGWVHRDAFSAVVQDAGPLVCPAGEIALAGDTPFCGKLCSADADCPTIPAGPQACKGSANKLLANGKAGDGVTVCTVFHPHDAGPPPPPPPPPATDAGKLVPPVSIDAGKTVLIDAGPPPPPPPPPTGADVVEQLAGGKCANGFVPVEKTKKCHRPCPGGPTKGECSTKSVCIKCNKPEVKVCAAGQGDCR